MSSGVIILICLLLSAFFSGMEIAFVSANKLKVELDKQSGMTYSRLLEGVLQSPAKFIATMLVGNNIALVVYGVMMAKLLEPTIEHYTQSSFLVLLIQTIISTLIILVTAEFLPKAFFRINPNQFLKVFAIPLFFFYYLLWPIVRITIFMSKIGLRLIGAPLEEEDAVFRKVDLEEYLKSSSKDEQDDVEVQMLQNALDFSSVKVRECMVPRTEIVAVALSQSIDDLAMIFVKTKLSKVLVYEENIDHIIGYAHSIEMFKNPSSIRSILLPIPIVPETMLANELMETFTKERKAVAVVVDEFGGTSGMVTIEDVMEEIFGEIEDEHDEELLTEEILSSGDLFLSARLEVDYLNEKYNLDLPESEAYETLGGLIVENFESIPNEGAEITIGNYTFKAEQVSETRIEKVLLKGD
ncbi:MAG: hemolysin [Flavobacteriales bacterium]|nr:hemolysin [Flavobacteriales bacterium]|tara:strand:- start:9519 stop:10754 length:1236 start_codon:yes stop_codon:yes gene_type:complete